MSARAVLCLSLLRQPPASPAGCTPVLHPTREADPKAEPGSCQAIPRWLAAPAGAERAGSGLPLLSRI